MRTSTFNYIKDILADYYKTDEYIKKREEELRYPYKETDLNADIQGTGIVSAPTERLLITIATDRRLCNLERNRNITRKVLEESDDQTVVIIQELYLKQRPTFTLVGIAQKLYISKNTAYRLRNKFFEQMAEELEI